VLALLPHRHSSVRPSNLNYSHALASADRAFHL
jgi:hypothetical protein